MAGATMVEAIGRAQPDKQVVQGQVISKVTGYARRSLFAHINRNQSLGHRSAVKVNKLLYSVTKLVLYPCLYPETRSMTVMARLRAEIW